MEAAVFAKKYFNGFSELRHCTHNNVKKNALALVKIISYLTGVIPLLVGLIYLSTLQGRVSVKTNSSPLDQKVETQREKVIPAPNQVVVTPQEAPKVEPSKEQPKPSLTLDNLYERLNIEVPTKPIEKPAEKPVIEQPVRMVTMAEELAKESITRTLTEIKASIESSKQRWNFVCAFQEEVSAIQTVFQDPSKLFTDTSMSKHNPQDSSFIILKASIDNFVQKYEECKNVTSELELRVVNPSSVTEASTEAKRIRDVAQQVRISFDQIYKLFSAFQTIYNNPLIANLRQHIKPEAQLLIHNFYVHYQKDSNEMAALKRTFN